MKEKIEYHLHTDAELIVLYYDGHQLAFDALVKRHAADLKSYCLKYIKDKDDSKDACQDTWVQVLKMFLEKLYKESGKFIEWLRSIAFHVCQEIIRKKKKQKTDNDESKMEHSDEGEAVEKIDAKEKERRKTLLEKYFPLLTLRMQDILVMHYVEGKGYDEIGIKYNCKASTLRSEVSKIMKKLKIKLS